MGTRIDLHNELLELAPKAYFQPPATVRMEYPCFRYNFSGLDALHADNAMYRGLNRYSVTYISRTHAEEIVLRMKEHFKYCRFDRSYTADNLYHYAFELYY